MSINITPNIIFTIEKIEGIESINKIIIL